MPFGDRPACRFFSKNEGVTPIPASLLISVVALASKIA
jgi:hypothetical protein